MRIDALGNANVPQRVRQPVSLESVTRRRRVAAARYRAPKALLREQEIDAIGKFVTRWLALGLRYRSLDRIAQR